MTFRNTISLLVAFLSCQSPGHTFFDTFMYTCSSAMVCVDIAKCDKVGIISNNDVILSQADEQYRSPLVPCRRSDGDQGVCCRDPNYKDDWPTDVKYYDQKGKWNPKPTIPQIVASDSKATEVRICTPPEVKLPNGKCAKADVVSRGSSFGSEGIVKVPTKAPLQYLPPVTELPCPAGTKRGPRPGSCESVEKNVPKKVTPSIVKDIVQEATKAPVVYLPPKSSSHVKENAECTPNEIRLPNGECGVKVTSPKPPTTYLPPVPQKTCPPGTNRTLKGCEATLKIYKPSILKVTPSTIRPPPNKPTLPYMPDRTYLPPPPATQLKADEVILNSIPDNNEAQSCKYGSIFEHNNKRYCCELIS